MEDTKVLTETLLFHLLDLTIVNSYTILSSCGSEVDHRNLSGSGWKFVGNEYKGVLSSIHTKRKTKPTNQPNETP
jgi:hypothetical protein